MSRDTLELLSNEYAVSGYVARQSLISASTRPVSVQPQELQLSSAFQQRQVEGDAASNLFPLMSKLLPTIDLFVMDIMVERLGVRNFGGSFLTYSNELLNTVFGSKISSKNRFTKFGSDEHFIRWSEGARKLSDTINTCEMQSRAVVLQTPWASHSSTGTATQGFRGMSPSSINDAFARYYKYLETLGFQLIRLPVELAVADDNHKWGPAGYHYVSQAYDWLASEIRKIQ